MHFLTIILLMHFSNLSSKHLLPFKPKSFICSDWIINIALAMHIKHIHLNFRLTLWFKMAALKYGIFSGSIWCFRYDYQYFLIVFLNIDFNFCSTHHFSALKAHFEKPITHSETPLLLFQWIVWKKKCNSFLCSPAYDIQICIYIRYYTRN